MKRFLFITDFDGTATAQDFFLQIMYRYKHKQIFSKRQSNSFDFLSDILGNINITEQQLQKEIEYIPLDPFFVNTIKTIKELGGDIVVLSAGSTYYIRRKLAMVGLDNIDIISNKGIYKDGGIKLIRDHDNEFYCDMFGIDKIKVVKHFKKYYKTIAYAGDSRVDFDACRLCDIRFAKNTLSRIFDLFLMSYYKFENFDDIKKVLIKKLENINWYKLVLDL